jgi:cyclopropane fatty-acyl-phospholipid synthase-like methyltransferase
MIPRMAWRIDPEGAELAALQRLASLDGQRVLELGCGDGRLTFQYASSAAFVLAVDTDAERIADAVNARPEALAERVHFEPVGAAEVEAPARSFDVALFSSSL